MTWLDPAVTAAAHLGGLARRWHPHGAMAGLLGFGSGFFGGPAAFVATSTATGLPVDAARTPVYLWQAGGTLLPLWPTVAVATAGVVAGTLAGERLLLGLPPERFGRIVAVAIGLLGIWLLVG